MSFKSAQWVTRPTEVTKLKIAFRNFFNPTETNDNKQTHQTKLLQQKTNRLLTFSFISIVKPTRCTIFRVY